jgi:hypothetical protein
MDIAEKRKLFQATAAVDTPEGRLAYRAFAASATKPILQKLEQISYMRQLFRVERLGPGQQPVYPLPDEFESPIWILPAIGRIAEDTLEFMADEVTIRTFTVQAAKNWLLRYAREGRVDVAVRAQQEIARALAAYEEEAGWRVVVPAATSAFDGAGVLAPRPAPIYEMPTGDPASGYFSKELINRMIIGMKRLGRKLTELWVSPEDIADIREWGDTDIDPMTRNTIFQAAGLGSIWGIQLREVDILGVRGQYNINDKDSEFGPFKGSSDLNKFNDYAITHGNLVDSNGNLQTAGETQIYGFDTSDISLVMPIKEEYVATEDSTLHRRQQAGIYGWQTFGMACLDARFICVGIIDRYTPSGA